MTRILFDVINLDSVGYHKLFHKRSSRSEYLSPDFLATSITNLLT